MSALGVLLGIETDATVAPDVEGRLVAFLREPRPGCRPIDYEALAISERVAFVQFLAACGCESELLSEAEVFKAKANCAFLLPTFFPFSRRSEEQAKSALS